MHTLDFNYLRFAARFVDAVTTDVFKSELRRSRAERLILEQLRPVEYTYMTYTPESPSVETPVAA